MAKKSKIVTNEKRVHKAAAQKERRDELRERSLDMSLSLEERMEARVALSLLPRNGSITRVRNRCKVTGRPRGYSRRLGISRVLLRRLAHEGVLPGLNKSSW